MANIGTGKRNLRIDSLPHDRQIAEKDCRQCVKRRIKCDRTLPHCRKCELRDISCSGFDRLQLRWNQGIASRGRFRGKGVPLPKICGSTGPHLGGVSIELSASPSRDASVIKTHLATSLNDKLLHHFFSTVVPRLTWLDVGPSNPWRRLIQPLASQSHHLRLSISGLAAAHLAATVSGEGQSSFFLQVNNSIRDETLKTLSHGLRNETNTGRMASRQLQSSETEFLNMLASALVLCYSEMHIPSSNDWGLHLRACRAMVERCFLLSQQSHPHDALSKFLIKEVADLETFGNLARSRVSEKAIVGTNFNSLLHSNLWTFTALIDELTRVERLRSSSPKKYFGSTESELEKWHGKLGAAYESANEMITSLPECDSTQSMFRLVIDAHYYATLLYCYQCLTLPGTYEQQKREFCDTLWHSIQSVTDKSSAEFIHDVFFPLFIVGTQSLHDMERQAVVEAVFLQTMHATGFWCNQTALQMLRSFWTHSDRAIDETWIQFVRRNAAAIGPFVIF
ncbi:hypothetical protein N7539_002544 [Penicillium diatomitis]|uniref:Zn(2)-C6 fungal-type domain-containing protein n=1 Tax=Penicillium diatomitis TaxID=2819901 RepID=A0A9X0BZA5_9EURO|nr:uncharacterized protein N7539_002544 [Penicillium diatomitis]KAJ5490977.1 hypothetical protein N7539_002544 [Penicillium diatomitis]